MKELLRVEEGRKRKSEVRKVICGCRPKKEVVKAKRRSKRRKGERRRRREGRRKEGKADEVVGWKMVMNEII